VTKHIYVKWRTIELSSGYLRPTTIFQFRANGRPQIKQSAEKGFSYIAKLDYVDFRRCFAEVDGSDDEEKKTLQSIIAQNDISVDRFYYSTSDQNYLGSITSVQMYNELEMELRDYPLFLESLQFLNLKKLTISIQK